MPTATATRLYLPAVAAAAAALSCPAQYSNGPCFTAPRNWTEAQRHCERHGSNLVTVLSDAANTELGQGGCFAPAPWNGWRCTWVGLNDLRTEGSFEWASGAAFSFQAWGMHEPDTTEGNGQDCTAVCHGGEVDGYSGEFWLDLECDAEYPFCCDENTFDRDAGTSPEGSFLANLEATTAPMTPPPPPDPDPYDERLLCFSTQLTWMDAQSVCQSMGSHLMTIHTQADLAHVSRTAHYSRVPATWGLDWRCLWTGFQDRQEEGRYQWMSGARPSFTPPFGPFEAGNGDGEEEDCVAVCRSDCLNASASGCMDLAEYGYVGDFLIDTQCGGTENAYAFCCDGLAATYVTRGRNASANEGSPDTTGNQAQCTNGRGARDDATIAVLAAVAGVALLLACLAVVAAVALKRAKPATPTMVTMPSAGVAMGSVSVSMYNPPDHTEKGRA